MALSCEHTQTMHVVDSIYQSHGPGNQVDDAIRMLRLLNLTLLVLPYRTHEAGYRGRPNMQSVSEISMQAPLAHNYLRLRRAAQGRPSRTSWGPARRWTRPLRLAGAAD